MQEYITQLGLSIGIPIAIGLFARLAPKKRISDGIRRLDAFLAAKVSWLVKNTFERGAYALGVSLSKLLTSKVGAKLGEKVEEGIVRTIVTWIADIVAVTTNRIIELVMALQSVPDEFMKGVESDNEDDSTKKQ